MLRIRPVTLHRAGRPARDRSRLSCLGLRRLLGKRPAQSLLEENPLLWRELSRRRVGGWQQAIWILYAIISALFTVVAIARSDSIAAGTCAFMVSIGLLMVSVTSATALAEERAHGNLEVLMASPLSSRALVLAKWRGAYRVVPWLSTLPGLLALGTALGRGLGPAAILFALLIAAIIMAYGAVITSVGLYLAAWQTKQGRAVALSVAAYLAMTVVYPTILLIMTHPGPDDMQFLWMSPFFGMFIPMGWITWNRGLFNFGHGAAMFLWAFVSAAAAKAVLHATVKSFDRLLGRMPERSAAFVTSHASGFPLHVTGTREDAADRRDSGHGFSASRAASSRTT
jgi:ABC-type transport system involved in multi-copper enzyme maturation permease subunit